MNQSKVNEHLVDVKLDLKDGKSEFYYLRNWVKCYVKIEAIECFPCYLKFSFFYNDDLNKEHPFAIIRINIPGVQVDNAASRTKSLAYGVFWKNNRKRCKLFFGFDQNDLFKLHIQWLRTAIDSLEDYRKNILKNHRIGRVLAAADDDDKKLKNIHDVLGPLPAIPIANNEEYSRWSIRRASGYSGIYEEILETNDSINSPSIPQKCRNSAHSSIYVDMTGNRSNENLEIPPPLPPRRRFIQNTTIPTDLTKPNKRSWNVFGRNGSQKMPDQQQSTTRKICNVFVPFTKNRPNSQQNNLPKSQSEHYAIDLLQTKQNSFSTPDLTNIIDINKSQSDINDDIDLDIMDIERSNSLNSTANQFLCRPPTLNISSNILWSYNLSSTIVSTQDQSKINLVGANVNSESFLDETDDMSGYCRMAPIIKNTATPLNVEQIVENDKTTTTTATTMYNLTRLIDNSGYCRMRPVIDHNHKQKFKCSLNDSNNIDNCISTIKNQSTPYTSIATFADDDSLSIIPNKYELDDGTFSLNDFSMLPHDKHSSNTGITDETSSSGVSSDDGNIHLSNSFSSLSISPNLIRENNNIDNDNISIALTNSPGTPDSIKSIQRQLYTNKFDDKYPSYYPNVTDISPFNKTVIITPKLKKLPHQHQQQKFNDNHNLHQHIKSTNNYYYKNVIKPIPSSSIPIEIKQTVQTQIEIISNQNDTLNSLSTSSSLSSSPRRIYAKCATLAARFKASPTTSITDKNHSDLDKSFRKNDKRISISKSCNFDVVDGGGGGTDNDENVHKFKQRNEINNSNGMIQRFATISRFKKIDFSPLKIKLNNILQRPEI